MTRSNTKITTKYNNARIDLTEGSILKTLVKLDNALFAALVLTLPVFFGWGIQSVWWIKLATAAVETAVVAVWLKRELTNVRSSFAINCQPAKFGLM